MKTLYVGGLVATALVLAIGGTQAAMMQSQGGPTAQQLTTSGRVTTAPASSGVSQPVFIGRGAGFEGHPSPAAQFAHPGHTSIHPQPAPVANFVSGQGDHHFGGHVTHGVGFDHGRFDRFPRHRHSIVVFVNGAPCWFPVYTAYPYYYDASPPVTYGGTDYPSDSGYVPPMDSDASQATSDYADVGTSWGQDLRRDVVT